MAIEHRAHRQFPPSLPSIWLPALAVILVLTLFGGAFVAQFIGGF